MGALEPRKMKVRLAGVDHVVSLSVHQCTITPQLHPLKELLESGILIDQH